MLSGSISTSERVNKLSLKAALLYTWMLAHCDDQGRISADPHTVKGTVCPMRRDIRERDIQGLLEEASGRLPNPRWVTPPWVLREWETICDWVEPESQ